MRFLSRRWRWSVVISLACLLTTAAVWLYAHEGHQPLPSKGATVDVARGLVNLSPEARAALGVRTAEASTRTVEDHVLTPATIVAPWQRHAFATTRLGGKVAAVHVKPGQKVTAGQPLADVESLELENLQLDLLNAHNDVRLAAENLMQLEAAGQRGAVSGQELLEARARHQEGLNALEITRRKLLLLDMQETALDRLLADPASRPLRTLPIHAPVSGVVIDADVVVGQVVEPAEHLFEVIDLSRVWVRFGVLERDLFRVVAGRPFELRLAALPGEVLGGTVQDRGLALDPQTHLGAAWAELPNPGERLLPGMFGQAQVSSRTAKDALVIPAAALVDDGAEQYVFVEEGPGQYAKANVTVGQRSRDVVQVLHGRLVPGDRVVTAGSHELASFFAPQVLHPSTEAVRNLGLSIEPAAKRAVEKIVELNGVVELPPDRRGVASVRLPGTIRRIRVGRDQAVRAGDVLADVASLELSNLQLELRGSHLKVMVLEQTLDRLHPLAGKDGALPSRQLRETQSAHRAVLSRRDSLRRKLLSVGLTADQITAVQEKGDFIEALPVRAPLAGVVVRFRAALGQAVKVEDPLFDVYDLDHAAVRGFVFERQLPDVRVGQPVRVRLAADPGFVADAVVARSGQVFGGEDRTLSVWAEFRDRPRRPLLPDMLARLALVVAPGEPVLAVPRESLVRDGTAVFLFVQRPDGIFERRFVITGRADDRFVEITRGLEEGERVAVRGAGGLQTAHASLR